jgi:GDPmannose 4,6-dehydratase
MKKIFITGITGQDGIFLTKELLLNDPKTTIIGTSRKTDKNLFYKKLKKIDLNNFSQVKLINVNLQSFQEVNNLVTDFQPNMIFNLAGPSSPTESLKRPALENEINNIFNNLTKSFIENRNFCRFFQASSSEMFGESNVPLDEKSELSANSPYAEAKINCHKAGQGLAEKYDWPIISGILFNHESEFRAENFLFSKIVNSAIKISQDKSQTVTVGSLDLTRDWSYAEDIVKGFYNITKTGESYSYVLGSGIGSSIEDILNITFSYFNLDWNDYVEIDPQLLREGDPIKKVADIRKIKHETGWSHKISVESMLEKIIDSKLKNPN